MGALNRPLLIGQAPGPRTRPDCPLFPFPTTSAGGRLKTIMGITRREYLSKFDRINLLPYFPGQHKRDDKFPMPVAKLAAAAIRPLLAGRTVILVGRNVADAFDHEGMFHAWSVWQARRRCPVTRDLGHGVVAVVPHPSGRCRWYNEQGNREEAIQFWHAFLNS